MEDFALVNLFIYVNQQYIIRIDIEYTRLLVISFIQLEGIGWGKGAGWRVSVFQPVKSLIF